MPMLLAPNERETVAAVMREHPEIDTRNEDTRGRILDHVAHRLNRGADRPWGRKARMPNGGNKNTDGLTYLRPDGMFEIYDVISGVDGSATWDEFGPFNAGENGWWAPAEPIGDAPPAPVPTPDDQLEELAGKVGELMVVADLLIAHMAALVGVFSDVLREVTELRKEGVRLRLR